MTARKGRRQTLLTLASIATGCSILLPTAAYAAPQPVPVSPKNVIVLIGDGMGYNHLDLYNAYSSGKVYYQVERGGDRKVTRSGYNSETPKTGFQSWNRVSMETTPVGGSYDTNTAWGSFDTNKTGATDSAAAGTAMATGVKTKNGILGFDADGNKLENLSERAKSLGKAAGVVSNVPYSHATPAAYSAHNQNRNDLRGVAHEQLTGELEVVMGAGHPEYDDDHKKLTVPKYQYITEADFGSLKNGQTPFTFIEEKADFAKLAAGSELPKRVFGITQVGSTNQADRTAGAPANDVPSLATMSRGALNVLNQDKDGFFLTIEGGAIDWTGHGNVTDRDIEETTDFVDAVNAVETWVEKNSSWDETLVIVTADHETGYLSGSPAGDFQPIVPVAAGTVPEVTWNSGNHTNQLVGLWYKGAGADALTAAATQQDMVRGSYLANTAPARWLLDTAWVQRYVEQPEEQPAPQPEQPEQPEQPGTQQPAEKPSKEAVAAGGNGAKQLATTGQPPLATFAVAGGAMLLLLAGGGVVVLARMRAAHS